MSSFIFHFPIKSFQPEVDVDEEKDLIGHFFEVKVEEEDNPQLGTQVREMETQPISAIESQNLC